MTNIRGMDLPQSVIDGLGLTGDSVHIADKQFKRLIDRACSGVLEPTERNSLENDPMFEKVDKAVLKEVYASIVSTIIEAAKQDVEPASLSSLLEDCKFTSERINVFNTVFQERKSLIQILLGNVGTSPPHIVDVDWRLDYYIKNNHLEKVNEAVYLISLKTEVPGKSDLQEVQFSCSLEQLQDLVGKLKDATKCLEKVGQV